MASNDNKIQGTGAMSPASPASMANNLPEASSAGENELTAIKAQLESALAELASLKQGQPATRTQPQAPASMEEMPPEMALEAMMRNPVIFIQEVIEQSAGKHLWNLKEEAELRGALNAARTTYPEFERFEPFIMQEVSLLIQNDPDGVIDPWQKLFEKGVENFKQKFREMLKDNPEMLAAQEKESEMRAFVEGKSNRAKPEIPPSFSREQIARMSLDEFLKNEAAINEALKNNRIK